MSALSIIIIKYQNAQSKNHHLFFLSPLGLPGLFFVLTGVT